MYYERNGCKLVFFHIPRTGGRWVQWFLKDNNFNFKLNSKTTELNFEPLHYPKFLVKQDVPDYISNNEFSVVRDPVDRFLSGVGYHEVNNLFELSQMSRQEFHSYLEDHMQRLALVTQLLVPQHWFVDNKVTIYKFENGLGENFKHFLEDSFNITSLQFNRIKTDSRPGFNNNRDPLSFTKHRHLMPPKLIDNIISYYERDYEMFGYEPVRYPKN